MARYSISGRTTAAPTSTLPAVSLYAIAGVAPRIIEIGVFNTTATEFVVALNRLTSAGTQGAGLTEAKDGDSDAPASSSTGFAAHSVGPTVSDELRRATLGAAKGSGVVWTWDEADGGLRIPAGTANGIGLLCPTGTGQVFDYYISYAE